MICMVEGLLKLIGRKRISDSELLVQAEVYEKEAASQQYWLQAKDYLKRAKKRYSRLQEGHFEHLLEHARYAESLLFPRNNFELEAQFNYSRRIYQRENSEEDLYKLARHAEEAAFGFITDIHQVQFLEYARIIFLKLDKKEDVKRLAQKAAQKADSFGNPVSESRFLDFAVKSYRKIDETETADLLKDRAKEVGSYLTGCLVGGIEPKYAKR